MLDRTNCFASLKRIRRFNASQIADRPLIGSRICTCGIFQRICDDLEEVGDCKSLSSTRIRIGNIHPIRGVCRRRSSLGICCFKCCQCSRRCCCTNTIDSNVHQGGDCCSNCCTSRRVGISSDAGVGNLVPTVGGVKFSNSLISHNADRHIACLSKGIRSIRFITRDVSTSQIQLSCIINKVITTVCQVVCHRFNHIHDVGQAIDISTRNCQGRILLLSIEQ